MSPLSSITPSSRESYSEAVTRTVPPGTSITPSESIRSSSTGASGDGSSASSEPRITTTPCGSETTIPSSPVISVGEPHPIWATGPMTVLPSASGKYSSIDARISVAVADRVVREQQRVDRALAQAGGQRLGVDRAVDGENAAEPEQREAEAERQAGEARRQAGEQRPAVGVTGQPRVDDADRVDADREEVEADGAAVAADLGVQVDHPAAAADLALEGQPEPRGRHERERGVVTGRSCRRRPARRPARPRRRGPPRSARTGRARRTG